MIKIEIPKYGLELECSTFNYEHVYGYNGLSHIKIDIVFNSMNEVIHNIALTRKTINEMLVSIFNEQPIIFRYIIIDREEVIHNFYFIHMKALRVTYNSHVPEKVRVCECSAYIEYPFVVKTMRSKGISIEAINEIWNNELFVFKCCQCFKRYSEHRLIYDHQVHSGQYISIGFGNELPLSGVIGVRNEEDEQE